MTAAAVIPLTQGKFALVDECDLPLIADRRWHAVNCGGGRWYARSVKGYMHRLIARASDGEVTDHRDGNGLNNTRENLRSCRQAENLRNRAKSTRHAATSQYKGVYWAKDIKRWRAYVEVDGKRRWLGCFMSEHEAAEAYNRAALDLHGEFARLNEISSEAALGTFR